MQGELGFHEDRRFRRRLSERLFFALFPDPKTAICVGQIRQQLLDKSDLVASLLRLERLHITIQHVGDYARLRPQPVYAACQAGEAVLMHAFEVTFRFITTFVAAPSRGGRPRRWPLVLLAEGEALFELHKMLGTEMENNGLRAAEHFTPHMTLAYCSRPVPQQAIKPFRFLVSDFALIHSEVGLTRYNLIGRWSLEPSLLA